MRIARSVKTLLDVLVTREDEYVTTEGNGTIAAKIIATCKNKERKSRAMNTTIHTFGRAKPTATETRSAAYRHRLPVNDTRQLTGPRVRGHRLRHSGTSSTTASSSIREAGPILLRPRRGRGGLGGVWYAARAGEW